MLNAHFLLILSSSSSTTRSCWETIFGFLCHHNGVIQTHSYNSQRKAKVRKIRTKRPTKANTDHHNGDLKWNKYHHLNNVRKFIEINMSFNFMHPKSVDLVQKQYELSKW